MDETTNMQREATRLMVEWGGRTMAQAERNYEQWLARKVKEQEAAAAYWAAVDEDE